jgi:hypothetical protein
MLPNVAGVGTIRWTFTVDPAASGHSLRIGHGGGPGSGDVWWDNIMVVEGVYNGDFIDGTKPFSKWEGTANASSSVGYPPQLIDIAGKPVYDFIGPATDNTVSLDNSFTNTEPRTIYTVYSSIAQPAVVTPIVTYGITGLSDTIPNSTMMLRLQATVTPWSVVNRRSGGTGPVVTNVTASQNNVACWGMASDGTQFIQNNNSATVTNTQVMDVPHQSIKFSTEGTYHKHLRTLIYRGYHDDTTRTAISRYLGNKYGASVA